MTQWFVLGDTAHRKRDCPELEGVTGDGDLRAVVDEALLSKIPYRRCDRCRWPDPPTLD